MICQQGHARKPGGQTRDALEEPGQHQQPDRPADTAENQCRHGEAAQPPASGAPGVWYRSVRTATGKVAEQQGQPRQLAKRIPTFMGFRPRSARTAAAAAPAGSRGACPHGRRGPSRGGRRSGARGDTWSMEPHAAPPFIPWPSRPWGRPVVPLHETRADDLVVEVLLLGPGDPDLDRWQCLAQIGQRPGPHLLELMQPVAPGRQQRPQGRIGTGAQFQHRR